MAYASAAAGRGGNEGGGGIAVVVGLHGCLLQRGVPRKAPVDGRRAAKKRKRGRRRGNFPAKGAQDGDFSLSGERKRTVKNFFLHKLWETVKMCEHMLCRQYRTVALYL